MTAFILVAVLHTHQSKTSMLNNTRPYLQGPKAIIKMKNEMKNKYCYLQKLRLITSNCCMLIHITELLFVLIMKILKTYFKV